MASSTTGRAEGRALVTLALISSEALVTALFWAVDVIRPSRPCAHDSGR
jgi:hypothetical protein